MSDADEVDRSKTGFPPSMLACSTFLLSKLGVESKRRSCEVLREEENLAPGHLGMLASLAEYGPASQKDLGDSLHYDASDVVDLVDELERRKWVERRVDPADRRRYAVTLTADGQKAYKRLMKALQEMNEEFLSVLSAKEQAALPGMLQNLLAAYDTRVTRR